MKVLCILIFLWNISCNPSNRQKNSLKFLFEPRQELMLKSIKCYYVSLDGKELVYEIKEDSLYAFGKKSKITKQEYEFLQNVPNQIKEKNLKYGCGICVDSTDFIFIFEFDKKKTSFEVQSGYSKLPTELENYIDVLIKKYDKQLLNL